MITKTSVTIRNIRNIWHEEENLKGLLMDYYYSFIAGRFITSRLNKWLMQYHTKVDVKVDGDLILASSRSR
jgi:hypothetical protein